jgi:hypothetical protein
MSDPLNDVSQAEGDAVLCPFCDSANIEEFVGDPDLGLDYRCLDCGAEFDPTGGRVNVE